MHPDIVGEYLDCDDEDGETMDTVGRTVTIMDIELLSGQVQTMEPTTSPAIAVPRLQPQTLRCPKCWKTYKRQNSLHYHMQFECDRLDWDEMRICT